jgi:choline dehydrogenase
MNRLRQVYDFVIVGAGTAGCVVAKKLSKKYKVLLLEAGQNDSEDPLVEIPSNSSVLIPGHINEYFWALGHQTGTARYPAVEGECWGGGSSVNGTQYVRGTNAQFDQVALELDDPDWNSENAIKIYKKIETFNGVPDQFDPAAHGESGPLDVRQATSQLDSAVILQNALASLPNPILPFPDGDYNVVHGAKLGSFLYWQLTQTPESKRESSDKAFLSDILEQESLDVWISRDPKYCLTVVSHAVVTKVLIKQCNCGHRHKPKAFGVRVLYRGCCVDVKSSNEVILATGFQSPKYLELSGIGDKDLLGKHGIPVLIDNPNVGRNMLNHPIFALTGTGEEEQFGNVTDPQGLYAGGAFFSEGDAREFQSIGIPVNTRSFVIATLLLIPESKGEVHIQANDASRMLLMDFNYFDPATDDLAKAVYAYGVVYQTLVNMNLIPTGPPPSDNIAVRAFILNSHTQAYHWTGTCRMSQTAVDGVTNSDGLVHGVRGLRVCDITIYPQNPRGNTQATAYLIGSTISKKILKSCHH